MLWTKFMKRYVALSLGLALLIVSCSLPSGPTPTLRPSPVFPVTGNPVSTVAPTLTPQPVNPEFITVRPVHGSALSFDGQDDYVLVADDPSLDLQNSFTIAAWIYLEDYREWASLVTKGEKPNINNYAIQQSGPFDPIYKTEFGKLRFSGCVGLSAPLPESATVLSLRNWYFVAVAFDGLRLSFYLNGKPDGSSAVSGPLCTNDSPLYIGVDFPLTTEYWHGVIDELRIWNLTLSESQIRDVMSGSPMPLPFAPVGYWAFDEGSGLIAHDLTGHGNDGMLVGSPAWINPSVPTQ